MGGSRGDRALGLRGFFYPFRGLRFLLGHPRLLPYVGVPVAINTALYALFLWFVGSRFWGWLEGIVPRGEAWYWALLFYVFVALFGVALGLMVVYTFTLVGGLVLAPFSEALSAAVERIYTGNGADEPFRLGALVTDLRRSLKAELGRFALYAAGFVLLLALHLLPVVGSLLYAVAMPLFTLFFLGWEYLDHSMERAHFTFGLKRRAAFRNGTALVGFGAGSALLLLIPLLNLLAIPVCVIGATLLFCDLESSGRIPARPSWGPSTPQPPCRAKRVRDERRRPRLEDEIRLQGPIAGGGALRDPPRGEDLRGVGLRRAPVPGGRARAAGEEPRGAKLAR